MVYLLVVAVLFVIDFICKKYVENHFEENKKYPVWKGKVIFTRHHNKGATLNFMEKFPGIVASVSVVVVLIIGLLLCLLLKEKGNELLKAGLAMILGGGFNNTYDRLKRGYVVDYLQFGVKWQPLCRVIFNLSDFFIMIGAVLVVFGKSN